MSAKISRVKSYPDIKSSNHQIQLPPHADDTSSHQLLDLHPHLRVLHVLLQGGGIALGLLENALHNGVLEDRHDLGIVLNTSHGLLLGLTGASTELRIQTLLMLLLDLTGVLAIVMIGSFSESIQSTVVLLHCDEGSTLAHVRTDELGVELDGLVTILHGTGECHQLDESGGTVGVTAGVGGGALGHLGESVDGGGPVNERKIQTFSTVPAPMKE